MLSVQLIAGALLLCAEQLCGDGGVRAAVRPLQPPHPRPGEARHQVCRIHSGNTTNTVLRGEVLSVAQQIISSNQNLENFFSSFKLNQTNRNFENFNRKVSLINHVN